VVFYFQAEDGIRDRNVTGVQTCALPISATLNPWDPRGTSWFDEQAVSAAPGAPVLLEVGALEYVLTDRVRAAAALLETRDALIGTVEHPGGHDVLQWQATIVDHLHTAIEATRFQR